MPSRILASWVTTIVAPPLAKWSWRMVLNFRQAFSSRPNKGSSIIQSLDFSSWSLHRASRRFMPVENFAVGRPDCNHSPEMPQIARLSLIIDMGMVCPRRLSQKSKLAAADSDGNNPLASGAIQLVHRLKSSSPLKRTSPFCPPRSPQMTAISVLLPEPLWPSIRINSPVPTAKLRLLNSGRLPKPNVKFLTSSIDWEVYSTS